MAQLLGALSSSRSLHFYDVVPLDMLLDAMAHDAPSVSHKIQAILVPSYFPSPQEGSVREGWEEGLAGWVGVKCLSPKDVGGVGQKGGGSVCRGGSQGGRVGGVGERGGPVQCAGGQAGQDRWGRRQWEGSGSDSACVTGQAGRQGSQAPLLPPLPAPLCRPPPPSPRLAWPCCSRLTPLRVPPSAPLCCPPPPQARVAMLLKANPSAGAAFCQYLVSSFTVDESSAQGFRWGGSEFTRGRQATADFPPHVHPLYFPPLLSLLIVLTVRPPCPPFLTLP